MSLSVNVEYNPYYLRTKIEIYGKDIKENSDYKKINDKIAANIPLQSWIDESYADPEWKGLLEELAELTGEINFDFTFTGRKIDFGDFKESIERQRKNSPKGYYTSYESNIALDDEKLGADIKYIVDKMLNDDKFKAIVNDSSIASDSLRGKYQSMKDDYTKYTNKEFKIVFSGLMSSGKSTVINALIGRRILPARERTCTSRVLTIKHNKYADKEIFLRCTDKNGEIVVKQETYSNDSDVWNRLKEICPDDPDFKSNPETVETIELEMDLGHLYPNESLQGQFTVVIVDTPGTDSGIGNNIVAEETHLSITLDAINNSKEMVIFNVDGTKTEDEDVIRFLDDIESNSKNPENVGFNDRFLFLMNKCDLKDYNDDESLEKAIKNYSDYLCISQNGKKREKLFPRIFPICAYPALAVKKGITDKSTQTTNEMMNMAKAYCDFKEDRIHQREGYSNNYKLDKYAAMSERQKEQLSKEYEGKGEVDQILLHTGIPSLECAIKQYIERYAYPLKARDLMNTFSGILSELRATITQQIRKIEEKLNDVEDAKKNEQIEKNKQDEFEKRLNSMDKLSERVNTISTDKAAFSDIIASFDCIIAKSKKQYKNEKEANDVVEEIYKEAGETIEKLNRKADDIITDAKKTAGEIIRELNKQIEGIGESLPEDEGEWFRASAKYKDIENICSADDLKKKISEKTEHVYDLSQMCFWKRFVIKYILHKDKKTQQVYDLKKVENYIEDVYDKISEFIERLKSDNEQNIKTMKEYIKNTCESVKTEIKSHRQRAEEFRNHINSNNSEQNKLELKNKKEQEEIITELYTKIAPASI